MPGVPGGEAARRAPPGSACAYPGAAHRDAAGPRPPDPSRVGRAGALPGDALAGERGTVVRRDGRADMPGGYAVVKHAPFGLAPARSLRCASGCGQSSRCVTPSQPPGRGGHGERDGPAGAFAPAKASFQRLERTDPMQASIHLSITQTLIEAIRAGASTGRLPWRGAERPIKLSDGTPYRGVNVLHLMAVSSLRGYDSPLWGGFGGWRKLGGHVRRGEHGTRVLYAAPIEAREEDAREGRAPAEVRRRIVRTYTVFNREQVDGLPAEPVASVEARGERQCQGASERADAFARALGAKIHHGGTVACYLPGRDLIRMPDRARFIDTEHVTADVGYASTLAHELVHWSASPERVDRACGPRGTSEYAREELVAELGAAFLAPELGFDYCGNADHAGYLTFWLAHLESDERALFEASADASTAVRWLQGHALVKPATPESADASA